MTPLELIMAELARAKELHPDGWPDTLDRMALRLMEEAGEVAKSVNDHMDHGEPLGNVRMEVVQTIVVGLRMLEAMEANSCTDCNSSTVWECQCNGYPRKDCILENALAGKWCKDAGSHVKEPLECAFAVRK